jgi:hypothetical protein
MTQTTSPSPKLSMKEVEGMTNNEDEHSSHSSPSITATTSLLADGVDDNGTGIEAERSIPSTRASLPLPYPEPGEPGTPIPILSSKTNTTTITSVINATKFLDLPNNSSLALSPSLPPSSPFFEFASTRDGKDQRGAKKRSEKTKGRALRKEGEKELELEGGDEDSLRTRDVEKNGLDGKAKYGKEIYGKEMKKGKKKDKSKSRRDTEKQDWKFAEADHDAGSKGKDKIRLTSGYTEKSNERSKEQSNVLEVIEGVLDGAHSTFRTVAAQADSMSRLLHAEAMLRKEKEEMRERERMELRQQQQFEDKDGSEENGNGEQRMNPQVSIESRD